jgi:hypothetical protein
MARPQKKGLDYFPLDVLMDIANDDIQMLEAKYTTNGFETVIKLYMKIYSDEGYFIKWCEKSSLLLAKRVNADINEVNDIINDLVSWGVFDKKLYKEYNVLTSKRVQKTYIDATKKRKLVEVIDTLFLLDEKVNSNINLINSVIYPQSKVKKSKVKKTKENIYREFKHLSLTIEEFNNLLKDYTKEQIDNKLDAIENHKNNKSYTSLNLTVRNWLKKDNTVKKDEKVELRYAGAEQTYGGNYESS